ncbi:Peptidase C48, SUMO/Sentrin/Ubl1 [Artemisia annua]|uniref:Peptidase C48, SUMO/Sentrin/Ubl1 n=1 Tax=Artemisia annua TaxID=35608 RepID=A0A2U1LWB1_ARTAN|nr:Peptidase C48, SUMO/Sentrin/Ubl1 [Artemisia annua]
MIVILEKKLADNKEDSGEPLKLSKKPRGKMIKGKRVSYSSSSSDEVGSHSSDDDGIVVKKLKRRKVSNEGNRKSGSSKLKKLLRDEDDDMESFMCMFNKLKGYIRDVSDSEDEAIVRKSKREVKNPKGKIKREGNDDMRDVSDSEDEAIVRKSKREVKKPKGKIKREGSDEDGANVKNPKRLGKKNMLLSKDEIEHLDYLKEFPILRVRNAPCSLFTSIRQSKVDMLRFLTEVGFQSFHRIFIHKLPSKLGRFVASRFNPATYTLNLFNGLSILVTPQKIHEMLGIPVGGSSLFSFEERSVKHPYVKTWVEQFYPKSFKEIRSPDIGLNLATANRVDDLFKLNFLMLFSNVIGRCDSMGGQVCFDVVRRIPEHLPISEIDWCGYIHHCLQYSNNPKGECHYTGPLAVLMLVYLDSTKFEKFHVVRLRPAILNWSTNLMRQRQDLELAERKLGKLELNPEWTEAEAKETEGFIDVVLSESSEKEVLFNKIQEKLFIIYSERHSLEADLVKAYNKYADDEKFSEKVSLDGEDIGGFSKISLEDFGKDSSQDAKEVNSQGEKGADIPADSEKPAENVVGVEDPSQGEKEAGIVEPAEDYELEINSTPETYTQWLYNNADLVNEGDTFDKGTHEELVVTNAGPATPERVTTRASKGSPEIILPEKRVVKLSSFLCSPYMNKKTKVVPRITKVEFMVGNSLFSMQADKIETIFETRSGIEVFSVRLNMETLVPGLCLDANVIDCWGAILNHEERFKDVGSLSRHFFPTGCITTQMIDGSLDSEGQWKSFEAQVSGHFKDVDGIDLKDIDLKDMFAHHLELHRHKRYASIKKLNAKIPRLKWSTRSNYRDCGVFSMLHMESYMGEAPSKWDCGLVAESKEQFDMLRRLRFKFATKMLLHELNVHREKMLDEAKEFDKLDCEVKMEIIVQARMNRKQREEQNEEELEAN